MHKPKVQTLVFVIVIAALFATTAAWWNSTPVKAASATSTSQMYVSSSIRNLKTGQLINLPVYAYKEATAIGGRMYSKITYTVGVPDTLFAPDFSGLAQTTASGSTITPYDVSGKNRCDPSSSWCVSLTQYYITTYDRGETCIGLQSPGYTAVWSVLDRSVLVSSAVMYAGIGSGGFCDGLYYNHGQTNSFRPVPGTQYQFMPSWGTRRADLTDTSFYQCGDTVTNLSRNGSNWQWVLYIGEGGACASHP